MTLVGGGGLGKTRLSIEVARHVQADFASGAAFLALADAHHAPLDDVVFHNENEMAQALADDRLLGHHDGVVLEPDLEGNGEEHAGPQGLVRVVELGSQAHGARHRIDARVDH